MDGEGRGKSELTDGCHPLIGTPDHSVPAALFLPSWLGNRRIRSLNRPRTKSAQPGDCYTCNSLCVFDPIQHTETHEHVRNTQTRYPMETKAVLRATVLEVVQNQIDADDPPETARTLQRLIDQGYTEEDSMLYLGQAVTLEIWDILTNKIPFNEERYIRNLQRLPKEPEA